MLNFCIFWPFLPYWMVYLNVLMGIKVRIFYLKKLKIFQNLCLGSKITSFVFSKGVKGLFIKTTKKFFRKLKVIEITPEIPKITNFWHFLKKYINIFLKQVIFGTIFNFLYCFRKHFEHNQFCLKLTYPFSRGGSYFTIIANPLVYGAQIVLLGIRIDHNMFTLVSSFGNPPVPGVWKKYFLEPFWPIFYLFWIASTLI